MYCFRLEAVEHRDADTWGVHLPGASAQGLVQRESLVDTVIDSHYGQADSIAGLGAGVAHLSDSQRGSLIGAALGLTDIWDKSIAIAGLGAGVAHLSEAQRDSLAAAAITLGDVNAKTFAIAGLAASIS